MERPLETSNGIATARRTGDAVVRGFTLIELIFAVLLFAGSLTVLLGVHSSAVSRTLEDRARQQALLAARKVLAAIEARDEIPPDGELVGTPQEVARTLLESSAGEILEEDEETPLEVRLVVEPWGLPNINEEVIKRVTVEVRWSEIARDSVVVTYFVPIEPPQTT